MTPAQAIQILEDVELDEDCGQSECSDCKFSRAMRLAITALKQRHQPIAWMYIGPEGIKTFRSHRWRNAQEFKEVALAEIPEGQVANQ